MLVGVGESGSGRVYVGEADALGERLRQHVAGKDFWTTFIGFTSSDGSLNKAYVRYLEARLIALATTANQWEVENGTAPGLPPLSEADRADAEWFLAEALVIFPILGVDAFESAAAERPAKPDRVNLVLRERGADARAHEVGDGIVVLGISGACPRDSENSRPPASPSTPAARARSSAPGR